MILPAQGFDVDDHWPLAAFVSSVPYRAGVNYLHIGVNYLHMTKTLPNFSIATFLFVLVYKNDLITNNYMVINFKLT